MTFYGNRGKFEGFSGKIGKAFSKIGLSPNQWTFVSLIPALAAVYYLVNQEYIISAGFFILAAFLDQLGIEHEDGVIRVDEFETPTAEQFTAAVGAVYEAFPADEAEVYFATLIAMEPEAWEGLIDVLERRD